LGHGRSRRHSGSDHSAIRGVKPWEIYSWQAPGWPEPHPAVIISEGSRVANKLEVNVLLCSTKEATRAAGPTEVILDKSDGLDWATLCKCDLTYSVAKAQLSNRRGEVTMERRRQIARKFIQSLAFADL
jgi:mRNA-degrading endonuclease toxin of MazEF toxin-antitoxin module